MKVLVLGASGMIGHRMWASLSQNHEVWGALRRYELGRLEQIPGISKKQCYFGVDAYFLPSVIQPIQELRPDVVLNCIGIVKQLKDSNNHQKSITLNALFPHQLAKVCAEHGARMLQFSSDCVFDGKRGNYEEKDFPNATDIYGRTKALGEVDDMPNVLTMRTSSIGREVYPHGGLLEWFLSNQGKKITGYRKAIYSGFPTHRLAKIIAEYVIPRPDLSGIWHIASEPIDKFSLLQLIKSHFHLNIDIGEENTISVERGLNCRKFSEKCSFRPPQWKDLMPDLEVDFEIYSRMRTQN